MIRETEAESESESESAHDNLIDPVLVKLTADLNVISVSSVYEELLGYLREDCDIVFDASAVNNIDTGGLELLLVFCREIRRQHRKIVWKEPSADLLAMIKTLCLGAELGLPG
jgi:ABC-type transporter Mla MlaB component